MSPSKAPGNSAAEPFVLLTGGEAATSSLISSLQTWGSLINPSEWMIYCFQLRSLVDWPSSAEAETPMDRNAPAVDPLSRGYSTPGGALDPGDTWTETRTNPPQTATAYLSEGQN